MKKKSLKENIKSRPYRLHPIIISLSIIIVLIGIFNIYQLTKTNAYAEEKLLEAKEAARPANISLLVLTADYCKNCVNISNALEKIMSTNINLVEEKNLEWNSSEGLILIKQYNITHIPAVIVTGETTKVSLQGFKKSANALIHAAPVAPYIDTTTGAIKGLVKAIVVKDSSCIDCSEIEYFVDELEKAGISVVSKKVYERNSKSGAEAIKNYNLTSLPALILSDELSAYGDDIKNSWLQLGRISEDGSYVMEQRNPPYVNALTGEILGLVKMTVLTDDSCSDCYDAEAFNKPILQRFGLTPKQIETVDISSAQGELLIKKYNITKIPAILLSDQAILYQTLSNVWKSVGSIEEDGTFVMRKVEVANQPYKDLSNGKIILDDTTSSSNAKENLKQSKKEFSLTAKNWEFDPGTITVNKGDTVVLKITSVDVEHGFSLPAFGIDEKLIPGETVEIEFFADQQGTFPFSCSVYCGEGHAEMNGELIVQ